MLHLNVIIIVCCVVSAPIEGIAVIRRKNYVSDGFCLSDKKIQKVTGVSSTNAPNADDEQFLNCVRQKITYRPIFFYNVFTNQYQNRKNNYCSMTDNFSEKRKKQIGSSVELSFRKRNLLWTQKGLQSLKTLNYTNKTSTTPKPITKYNLNFKEKKRLLALKKTKTHKQKRVRRYTGRKQFVGKSKKSREEENSFSLPDEQLSEVIWNGDYENKRPRSVTYPRFHGSKKFSNFEKVTGEKEKMRGQESADEEATYDSYVQAKFKNSHSDLFNKQTGYPRSVGLKILNKKKRLSRPNFNQLDDSLHPHIDGKFIQEHKTEKDRLQSNRFHAQLETLSLMKNLMASLKPLVHDSRLNENEELIIDNYQENSATTEPVNSNRRENVKGNKNLNRQKKNFFYCDYALDRSKSNRNTKGAVPICLRNEKQIRAKQRIEYFFKELLKASADYFNNLNEDFDPKSVAQRLSSGDVELRKETPDLDFDFPDYDEVYDAAADISLKDYYTPSHFPKRTKFKLRRNSFPKKRYSRVPVKLKSDFNRQVPPDLRKSLLIQRMERKKKCCCSKCSQSCETPHKCWKSAPLLCIPYIRKGQDDLLKYLIQIMQKMLTKPYPHKIDIFDNIKYKPCIKKVPPNTCEDIMPHEPDDDDDDDDDEMCNKSSCPPTPQPCPAACPPMPTPCPPSNPLPPASCFKNGSKNSNNPSCPSFPCTLPNLNQIYTETTPCSSDKCLSTLPSFLFPPSSVLKSNSNRLDSVSPSAKPTKSGVTSPSVQKNTLASQSVVNDYIPITFFPPKKISPENFKAKKINTNSFVSNDQLQSDQRLSDKILPELDEYQEEMKSLNFTRGAPEVQSTVIPGTSNEPLLFELPEFYNGGKQEVDFSNANLTNLFSEKDLSSVNEYRNQLFYSKNPIDVLPNKIKPKFHRKHLKERRRKKKLYYKHINNDDIYRSFSNMLPEVYDKSRIHKQLHSRQIAKKYNKFKKKKHLTRQKREDDGKVDDFLNYDSYPYNTNLNNVNYEEKSLQQLKGEPVNSDVSKLSDDYEWTPMKFEMFSELAKILTRTEYTDYTETVLTVSESSPTPSTFELSSITNDQLETNSVAVSTEKSSTTVFLKERSTNKTTSSIETKEYNTTSESKDNYSKDKTYSKPQSSTVELQEAHIFKEGKSPDSEEAEDGQIPTTLGIASLAKGPKKQVTKPSPKMYTKIYPDSVPLESEKNDTTMVTTTDAAPKRSVLVKTTQAMITPDIRLQLLAVCEGYLEVIRIMQSQNRSLEEDLDSDLSRYCENIISQSFTQQTDPSKSKKQEINLSTAKEHETFQNSSNKVENSMPQPKSSNGLKFGDPVVKKQLEKNKQLQVEKFNSTKDQINENNAPSRWQKKENVKKNKRKKKEFKQENQEGRGGDDEFLKKGMTKEQVELLHLLKKRKRELLNWLFNSREDQIQPDVEETEYFEDNDESLGDSLNFRNSSGTVRPRGAKSFTTTPKVAPDVTKGSVFPVYAKQYGYDKGGELRQVEVFWRKLNEQTQKKEIFKNLSVLALVLPSTVATRINNENNKFVNLNGYVNEDLSKIRTKNENEIGVAAEELQNANNGSVVKDTTRAVANTSLGYGTVTYINKPDPSSIIGTVTNITNKTTTKHPNITQKIAGKVNAAKVVVQEYTIEFWNYAVYILPIMFSILFLFCCTCCAMHILKKKKKKRKKKKNKKLESTDEETLTEETDSEPKKKKKNKSKKLKSSWNVWKKNSSKTDSDNNDEINPPKQKKSFLRFLKGKKNKKVEEASSVPYSALPESDEPKGDTQSEAAERKELIALLEELKKIEMENVGEKKEQKSVHVQYMIQDYDKSVFRRPEKKKGYPLYAKNFPFCEPVAEDYEIYKNAELTKLLPYECDHFSEKREYLRNCGLQANEGRCERFFKFVRNAGTSDHKHSKKTDTDEDGNLLFDKCKSTSTNDKTNEDGFKSKMCEMPPFNLPVGNPNDWIGEMEHFNRQMMKKKHVRLKDDGVLCRL